jgi:hypothetical protein
MHTYGTRLHFKVTHPIHSTANTLPIECPDVLGATVVICTNGTDSQVLACEAGRYVNNGTCAACGVVVGALTVTCTNATDSTPTACILGTFISGRICEGSAKIVSHICGSILMSNRWRA